MKPQELKRVIRESGLTRKDFAERLGVHPATIYRWLSGAVEIPGPEAMAIRSLAEKAGAA